MVMISLGHNCPCLSRCLPAASWSAFHCGSKRSQKSSISQNNSSKLISRSLRWIVETVGLVSILTHRNRVYLSGTHVNKTCIVSIFYPQWVPYTSKMLGLSSFTHQLILRATV